MSTTQKDEKMVNISSSSKPKNRSKKKIIRVNYVLALKCFFLIVVLFLSINYNIYVSNIPSKNLAYSKTGVQLYAGPGEEFAKIKQIKGYFEYEQSDNSWLRVIIEDEDHNLYLSWCNIESLDSWGEYKDNSLLTKK